MKYARIFYRVSSGPCHDALIAWRKRREAVAQTHWEFATSQGAVGLYPGSDDNVGNGRAIYALIFDTKLPNGWKAAGQRFHRHGSGQCAGKPDLRTKTGKAAADAISQLAMTPHVDKVTRAIGYSLSLDFEGPDGRGSRALGFFNCMTVGWIENTFYISLPDLEAERGYHLARGDQVLSPNWHPDDGMQPILMEEADLDFAREKAANKDKGRGA